MNIEEENVINTLKQGYGLTNAEQRILLNLIEKQQAEIKELQEIKISVNAVNQIDKLEYDKRLSDEKIHNLTATILNQNKKIEV